MLVSMLMLVQQLSLRVVSPAPPQSIFEQDTEPQITPVECGWEKKRIALDKCMTVAVFQEKQ